MSAIAVIRGAAVAAVLAASPLAAEAHASMPSARPQDAAADTVGDIDEARLATHAAALTADSTAGRVVRSRALETAAGYVAGQFERLGLRPGGDGAWVQRYPIPGQQRIGYDSSSVMFSYPMRLGAETVLSEFGEAAMRTVTAHFASTVRPAVDFAEFTMRGFNPPGAVIVTGRHTPASIHRAGIDGEVNVFYLPPTGADSAERSRVVEALYATRKGSGVIVLSDEDSVRFAAAVRAGLGRPFRYVDHYMRGAEGPRGWAVHLWTPLLEHLLTTIDVDPAKARADTTPKVRDLAPMFAVLRAAIDTVTVKPDTTRPPNVVAILEGTDPKLAREYVVISAHVDRRAASGARGDGRNGMDGDAGDGADDGADDNALGAAGLIELARAFGRPDARPRRPIVFLATSGAAGEFWGAHYFTSQFYGGRIVADINIDLAGAAPRDSVVVDGANDVELPSRVDWLLAAHPELRLTLVDGGTALAPTSDHVAFARKGVPSLHFHYGAPAGERGVATMPTPNAEQAARVLRLAFQVARAVADADRAPGWSAAGRRRLSEMRRGGVVLE